MKRNPDLTLDEALALYRVRWQIELLFKLWKQQGKVDEWRSENSWRIICEIYAKLVGLLLQHWLCLGEFWANSRRSLVKAGRVIRRHALAIAYAFSARGEPRRSSLDLRFRNPPSRSRNRSVGMRACRSRPAAEGVEDLERLV